MHTRYPCNKWIQVKLFWIKMGFGYQLSGNNKQLTLKGESMRKKQHLN